MNNRHYDKWVTSKSEFTISDNFADEVMQKISQQDNDTSKKYSKIPGFLLSIYNTRLAKAGIFITAAMLGVSRVLLIIYLVFEL